VQSGHSAGTQAKLVSKSNSEKPPSYDIATSGLLDPPSYLQATQPGSDGFTLSQEVIGDTAGSTKGFFTASVHHRQDLGGLNSSGLLGKFVDESLFNKARLKSLLNSKSREVTSSVPGSSYVSVSVIRGNHKQEF
jgi:hypothetical protein